MTDQMTIDHIVELKQRLLRDRAPRLYKRKFSGISYAERIEINTPFNSAYTESMSNRGNKLYTDESLRLSHLKSYPTNTAVELSDDEDEAAIASGEIFSNKRAKYYEVYDANGDRAEVNPREGSIKLNDEHSEDDDEDPLASIDLTEILAPIQHPSEIITRKSISKVFNPEKKGNHLLKLAYDTIEMIELEQENVVALTKLMNMFLGDEHHDLTPDNINLPDYDHKLSLKDLNASIIDNPDGLFKDVDSENEDDTKDEDDNRKMATRSKDNAKITDPFFQLPNFRRNKFIESIDPEEAEETRQLTQITLQRNQEFIRCLTKIRNGCVKVDKFKQNIHKWAREMAGDYSDDVATAASANGTSSVSPPLEDENTRLT